MPKTTSLLKCLLITMGILMIWPFNKAAANTEVKNAYDFTFRALQGEGDISLRQYKDKVVLVVNTASQCGFTGQYDGLEKLYEKYEIRGLVILGVPSNDFGQQEPGSSEQIAAFCKLNYGVRFPMTSKEHVTGDEAHPFYKWARQSLGYLAAPKWNFHKYLIDRQGNLVNYFYSTTAPSDPTLTAAIEKLLDAKAAE